MEVIHHYWLGPDGRLHVDIIRPEDFYLTPISQERPLIEDIDSGTEATVVAQLTRLADENMPVGNFKLPDGRIFAARRNDFTLEQITLANAADVLMPKVITQSPALQNAASLIDYVNRFKNVDSVTFADVKPSRIQTVLDYHGAATPGSEGGPPPAGPSARLGIHVATLDLPHSEEWGRWTERNEKLMSHIEFASFLEENAFDVTSPHGADLLELCRDLQVKQDVNFSSSIRMGDTASVSYQKEGDATSKGNVSLPVSFNISIPVYFGEPSVSITCFMRRQIADGKLRLGYKMIRLEQIKQNDFARVVGTVQSNTGITTVYGARGGVPAR